MKINFVKDKIKPFFGQDHIVRMVWSFIIALVFFVFGIWYNSNKEPSKVYVVNNTVKRDTVVLKIDKSNEISDYSVDRYLNKITNDIAYLKTVLNKPTESNTSQKNHLDSIPFKTFDNVERNNNNPIMMEKVKLAFPDNIASINIPRFILPSNIKGYTQNTLSSFAKIDYNKSTVTKNEQVEFSLNIFDNSIIKKITPLFVSVLRKESENTYTLMFNEQYQLQNDNNIIRFFADFTKGKYVLEVGLYFKEELNREYPPFYRSQLSLIVE